jgi:hypothetical protein
MKKILLLITSLLFVGSLSAQVATDALRLSQYGLNGTSNYLSRAGAIGALGGDLTAASFNPAGLGMFNSSEISFSTGLNWTFTEANANGLKSMDDRANLNFGHIAALFYFKPSNETFKGVQLSFGINRLKSYGNRTIFQRDNVTNSFASHIIDNGFDEAFMEEFFQAYVVDYDTVLNAYTSIFKGNNVNQIRAFKEFGSINEMTFSLSTNINNFIYLGGTIGVPMANYNNEASFTEQLASDPSKEYVYNENYYLNATGINFKFGAIVRPINWFRLGAAIHSPTFYSIEDNFTSEVSFLKTRRAEWAPIVYDLQSPFKFLGSLAFVLGDNKSKVAGSISADYEYTNYNGMKYRLSNNIGKENTINNRIQEYYRPANTLRIGAEVKLGVFALRAGYCIMDNPYDKDQNNIDINNAGATSTTFGVGYRNKNFFMDFAYAYTKGNSSFFEYDGEEIKLNSVNHLAQMTVGIRF